MRRSQTSALTTSPTMVGAVTTLVVMLVLYLAYNANNGLPFVPVYRVSVEVPNAARMAPNSEVRIGGTRVGIIESIEPVAASNDGGGTAARLDLKLDQTARPLPRDSIFRIRYKSFFGFKYLEIVRGTGKSAPPGYAFVGTDDTGSCRLPVDPKAFAAEIPSSARNGCYAPSAEFDDLANALDRRTRSNLRIALNGGGSGLAGRGASLNLAIRRLRPLLADLGPVARTLANPHTGLRRFIVAFDRANAAVASVAPQNAQLFTNAAVAFEALSRDPEALGDAISEGAPLLERGTPQLRRQRGLFADLAELERRLEPGAEQLGPTLPILNEAVRIGTPALARVPQIEPDLRGSLVELRRLVDRPSTGVDLRRLRQTFDITLPIGIQLAPVQTVCNYWNYWFTWVPEHLSDRSNIGFTQRNAFATPNNPSPGALSIGGTVFDFPSNSESTLTGYSGLPTNGRASAFPDPSQAGLFKPHDLSIGHLPLFAPTGQLTDEYPDCASGQFGYALGQLLRPGQPLDQPGIAVGDYAGSAGPTTLYLEQDGTKQLRDTRVRSRAPTTWNIPVIHDLETGR